MEYAVDLFEECGYRESLPEHLSSYFDMSAWARDLAYDHTVEPATTGGVHIFRCL